MTTHNMHYLAIILLFTASLASYVTNAQKLSSASPIPLLIVPHSTNGAGMQKPRLTLPMLANYGGPIYPLGPICTISTEIALDAIKNASLLSDYELVVEPYDEMCIRQVGINIMMNLMTAAVEGSQNVTTKNRLPVFLGQKCTGNLYSGSFVKYYNHVQIAGTTIVKEHYTDRNRFGSIFSVVPSVEVFYQAMPVFCKKNGWNKVFLLTETASYWESLDETMLLIMKNMNISLGGTAKIIAVSGQIPAPEHIERAVAELKAFDPRIIILDTNSGIWIACWLYKFKLFGPSYVIITIAGSLILPNQQPRYPDCTDEMIFQVLQSMIFVALGKPANEISGVNQIDSLGVNGKDIDRIMMDRIERPDLTPPWFWWRYFCYEETMVAALVLDSVEKELKSKYGDTLINWVDGSPNFRRNGSFIYNLVKRKLDELQFKGLTGNFLTKLNARSGITGFYQMQVVPGYQTRNLSLSEAIKAVQIATVNTNGQDFVSGPGIPTWRTVDGKPPSDSIRILLVKEPIVSNTAMGILKGLAAALIVFNCWLLALNTVKWRRSELVKKTMPALNSLILIGNVFLLCFVIILPSYSSLYAHVYCMAGSLSLIMGITFIIGSIIAKMEIALIVMQRKVAERTGTIMHLGDKTTTLSAKTSQGDATTNPLTTSNTDGRPRSRGVQEMIPQATIGVICAAFFELIVMAIWFAIDPIKVKTANERLEESPVDLSLKYQHFVQACDVNISDISLAFVSIFICTFLIAFLRSAMLAFFLRRASSGRIKDLHLFRFASYSIPIIVLAGGAVVWAIFNTNVGTLEIAVSCIALLVVSVDLAVIFVPKLRRGIYL